MIQVPLTSVRVKYKTKLKRKVDLKDFSLTTGQVEDHEALEKVQDILNGSLKQYSPENHDFKIPVYEYNGAFLAIEIDIVQGGVCLLAVATLSYIKINGFEYSSEELETIEMILKQGLGFGMNKLYDIEDFK